MGRWNKAFFFIALAVVLAACSGCATARHQLPKDLMAKATVCDMADIRTFLGSEDSPLQRSLIDSLKEEHAADYPAGPDGVRVYPLLAISGGSANGAYGAGLMKGWSAEGTRPKFKVVTGVSTGAITAPFVFLGKEYDKELEEIYTTMATKDVMTIKGPVRADLYLGVGAQAGTEAGRVRHTLRMHRLVPKVGPYR